MTNQVQQDYTIPVYIYQNLKQIDFDMPGVFTYVTVCAINHWIVYILQYKMCLILWLVVGTINLSSSFIVGLQGEISWQASWM